MQLAIQRSCAFLIVVAALLQSPASIVAAEQAAAAADFRLTGTYELVSTDIAYQDTGQVVPDIFGKSAKGFIMYGDDGRMLTMITYDGRPKPESIEKTTDEQRIGLYKTMQAYGGTYTFDGKTVRHHVDICWDELRCGTRVARDVERNGDMITLKTQPAPFSGNGRIAVTTLVWRKVK
jgi:hypothetical protein